MAAIQKRAEMAHFIALMRAQEAEDDEFIYWESHPWARFKRDWGDWAKKTLGLRTSTGRTQQGRDPLAKHVEEDL